MFGRYMLWESSGCSSGVRLLNWTILRAEQMTHDAPTTTSTSPAAGRWYLPTMDKFLLAVLLMEVVFYLSQHFKWFSFNNHKGHTALITIAATAACLLVMVVWFAMGRFFKVKSQFS